MKLQSCVFFVDIVPSTPLYIVPRHLEAQLLVPVVQTAFREKKLPEANAPSCATSDDFRQHKSRQRPCHFGKAFFCSSQHLLICLAIDNCSPLLCAIASAINFRSGVVQVLMSGSVVSVPALPQNADHAYRFPAAARRDIESKATPEGLSRLEPDDGHRLIALTP